MPTLETTDGKPLDMTPIDTDAVNRQFDAAMNDDPADDQAPPKRTRKPAAEAEAPKARRGRPPKTEQARTATPPPPEATPELTAKRAQNVAESFQIVGGALGLLGKTTKSVGLRADGYLLEAAAPKLGECVAEVAKYDPAVARFVDKSGGGGKVTAYAALFGCCASIGAQLAVNHKVLKPGLMGSVSAQEIIDALEPKEKPAEADTEAEAASDVPVAA